MAKKAALTPMMQQYWEVRNQLPKNTLLLFRLGDFYELFNEDAENGAKILGITLTKRHDYPMAGIPYHAADAYIGKVLKAGMKVAICDQVETPQTGKLVKRALTRIITPGTTLNENQLTENQNHFILAVSWNKQGIHASWMDLTTGEFRVATEATFDRLLPILTSINPREIVLPEDGLDALKAKADAHSAAEQFVLFCKENAWSEIPGYHYDAASGAKTVMDTLGVLNLEGFGLSKDHAAIGTAGALVYYVTESLCAEPKNLRTIRPYRSEEALLLDPSTLRNLEIFSSARGNRDGSLIQSIDRTSTAAGARMLEDYLAAPSLDIVELKRRQNCVGEFLEAPGLMAEFSETLRLTRDIKRILSRMQNRIRNPREIGGIRDTLNALPALKSILLQFDGENIQELVDRLGDFSNLQSLLERAINNELPSKLEEGGYIKDGYDAELDRMRDLMRNNKTWISDLEAREKEASGIRNLKIKYNNAFGYFIEVSKSNISLVPDHYIRKSTLVNAERYVTEELKEKEKEILHAQESSSSYEESLFRDIVQKVLDEAEPLNHAAATLAEADLFVGWAQLARMWDYCKPEFNESDELEIIEGRHPVVEQTMREEALGLAGTYSFVPNDTKLSSSKEQIMLITGPNMAGKSTYIRQVSLITLMAQIGCWVPAKSCKLGLVDRIFSRVGASDELARGNSTFMVEMNETANILNNATAKSLIILDEIGRGTSTYDGLSIAWSVIEHLHEHPEKGPKTLFATHYHELTKLEESLSRLSNYSVAVKEWNEDIIFVRQVIRGAADRSYGIHVARLAGLPQSVIERAKTILEHLENDQTVQDEVTESANQVNRQRQSKPNLPDSRKPNTDQLEFF
ncbi:MAG: DNA mismatch repair protein MutS [Verrucomicrobia bacterium]|nr:DNA mismatch repair protein MutS [Verrucomicrobiota bacterium]MDA1069135.1 DNA mismatch repair protein MutS [Verrucomicrobiota bacterium]